jgi:hypothetical protein
MQRHQALLMNIEAGYLRSRTWEQNAKQVRQFKKVLASKPNSEALPTLEDFLWDESEVDSSRGSHIPMSLDGYGNACRPLLSISTEVHLTDRFFQLRQERGELDRYRIDLLRSILRSAELSKRCETLIIHFEEPKNSSRKSYEQRLVDDLEVVQADTSIQIEYNIHSSLSHGRYLFSIKGGLQFDHGFVLDRTRLNHVHWLSTGELRPIWQRFGLAA